MPESHVWTTSNQGCVPNQVDEKVGCAYLHLGAPVPPQRPRGVEELWSYGQLKYPIFDFYGTPPGRGTIYKKWYAPRRTR